MIDKPIDWKVVFARNVQEERRRLGLDQLTLASRLGLDSRATVSIWESGANLPRMEIFEKLCKIFGRSPSEMMYEDLRLKPPPPEGGNKPESKEREVDRVEAVSDQPPQIPKLQAKAETVDEVQLTAQEMRKIKTMLAAMTD